MLSRAFVTGFKEPSNGLAVHYTIDIIYGYTNMKDMVYSLVLKLPVNNWV